MREVEGMSLETQGYLLRSTCFDAFIGLDSMKYGQFITFEIRVQDLAEIE